MSLTDFQRNVCRLLASNRIAKGECYVAGGAALNELISSPHLSHDVDVFHDTRDAVTSSWNTDRSSLESAGYTVELEVVPTLPQSEELVSSSLSFTERLNDSLINGI